MKEGQPKNIQRKEYTVPSHLIETTELTVDINEDITSIKSVLQMLRNPAANLGQGDRNLVLDGGEALETTAIKLDGRDLLSNEYSIEGEKLTLFDVPASFVLETNVSIKPQENTMLEG